MSSTNKRTVVPTEAGDRTKDRILASAEKLFAERGFDAVSMRNIGSEAQVPFALVSYHFGTKLDLYRAVFRRRGDLLTTERLDRLREIKLTGDVRADIRNIAAAIVEPLLRLREREGGHEFTALLAREVYDPMEAERGVIQEHVDPVAHIALDLLRQAVPTATAKQICWVFYFASGSLAITHADTGRLERLSSGECRLSQTAEMSAHLTNFIAAGWTGVLCQEPRPVGKRSKVAARPVVSHREIPR